VVPHTSFDTEAHWTTSGWPGWVYGWKLHLVVTVGEVWLPLAATVTPANRADNEEAPILLDAMRQEQVFILGDMTDNDPALEAHCAQHHRRLVTTQRGNYPHTDDGVEVRRLFHQLRSHAIENCNGQFKAICDGSRSVPTKGLLATQRQMLGAVLVYHLVVWHRFRTGGSLRADRKPLLQAA
jgi:hypothetical protein